MGRLLAYKSKHKCKIGNLESEIKNVFGHLGFYVGNIKVNGF